MNAQPSNHLDQELAKLEATAAAFASHFIPDAKVRREYLEQTKKASAELRNKVARNLLTPQTAAQQAQAMRNTILEAQRAKSTPLGLSSRIFLAGDWLKTLNYVIETNFGICL